jgi:hypothetical protein
MTESEVTKEVALRALKAKGLGIVCGNDDNVEIASEDETSLETIPAELGKKLVSRLARVYKVPIHWFYNPLMIPGEEDKKPPC